MAARPRRVVLHGLETTGKSLISREILKTISIAHAIVGSRECITGRHLLEQVTAVAADAIGSQYAMPQSVAGRCESLATLQVQLSTLLEDGRELVLVFDGIDRQREAPPTLIPALARFAETARLGNVPMALVPC